MTVKDALEQANVKESELSAVAVTVGPGLALCLEVGVRKALTIASANHIPIMRMHHMESHMMAAFLPSENTILGQFPAVVLLVSGGHNMLV